MQEHNAKNLIEEKFLALQAVRENPGRDLQKYTTSFEFQQLVKNLFLSYVLARAEERRFLKIFVRH